MSRHLSWFPLHLRAIARRRADNRACSAAARVLITQYHFADPCARVHKTRERGKEG